MAVEFPFGFGQNDSHGAELLRRAVNIGIDNPGGVRVNAAGVPGFKVTQNTGADMAVQVAIGEAEVPGSYSSFQGGYYVASKAAVTGISLAASNPTNPRWDAVCLAVVDTAYAGGSDSASITVVTGTAAASPTKPTLPANSLLLAYLFVAASTTTFTNANVLDSRVLIAPNAATFGNDAFRAYRAAGRNVATGWNNVNVDTASFLVGTGTLDVATNHRYIAGTPGYYHVSFAIRGEVDNNPQVFTAGLYKNGSLYSRGSGLSIRGGTNGDTIQSVGSDVVFLAVGDYVELWCQNTGVTSIPLQVTAAETYISGCLISQTVS